MSIEPRPRTGPPGPPRAPGAAGPPRVLVVDDSALVRGAVERLLVGQGYQVRTAGSGEEAFAVCLSEPFDLVVSDVRMEGLSGMQLCRLIRSDPITRGTPVILLTAARGARSRFWGRNAGADEYIPKERMRTDLLGAAERLIAAQVTPPSRGDTPQPAPDPMQRLSQVLDQHLFRAVVAAELRQLVDHLEDRTAFARALAELMAEVTQYAYLVLRLQGPKGPSCTIQALEPWPSTPNQSALGALGITPDDAAALDILVAGPTGDDDMRVASGEMALFPIEARGERLGELLVFSGARRLAEEDRSTLELVTTELGLLVQSLFLMEQTRQLAQVDALTGLANRRTTAERLQQELLRAERTSGAVSVALCDVDHFKGVNDVYGHNVGDEVLRRVADTLGGYVRQVDVAGRWGGEEFLVVLPDASEAGGRVVAERLRAAIASMDSCPEGPPEVTMSIGVATYRAGDSPDALVDRADTALYRAKERGRNRVEVATVEAERLSPPPEPPDASGSGAGP
jgi:two-component system, cell cycle response regulator